MITKPMLWIGWLIEYFCFLIQLQKIFRQVTTTGQNVLKISKYYALNLKSELEMLQRLSYALIQVPWIRDILSFIWNTSRKKQRTLRHVVCVIQQVQYKVTIRHTKCWTVLSYVYVWDLRFCCYSRCAAC